MFSRYKLFILLILCANFYCHINVNAQNYPRPEPRYDPPKKEAPFIFNTEKIMSIRQQAARAGWTESTIDSTMPDASTNGEAIWQQTVKAALLNQPDHLNETVELMNEHIIQAATSVIVYPSYLALLKSYDCMQALPEWVQVDQKLRLSLHENLANYTDAIFQSIGDATGALDAMQVQNARALAGIMLKSATHLNTAIHGSDKVPGLKQALLDSMVVEGMFHDTKIADHLYLTQSILPVAAALKTATQPTYTNMAPTYRASVQWLTELSYPNAQLPGIDLDATAQLNWAYTMEWGWSLFGDEKFAMSLNRLYQNDVRPADALMFGKPLPDAVSSSLFQSVTFPRLGASMFHQPSQPFPISVFLDNGFSRYHKAPAYLSLNLLSKQHAYSTVTKDVGTAGYNTVVIDQQDHMTPQDPERAQNALVYSFKPLQNDTNYIALKASGQHTEHIPYHEILEQPLLDYSREIYQNNIFVLDLFRVRGGSTHDYIYHSTGKIQTVSDLSATRLSLETYTPKQDDLALLQNASNLRSTPLQGLYTINFDHGDDLTNDQLWVIDPVGSTLITGEIDGHDFIILRRENMQDIGNLFTVLHEFNYDNPTETFISQLKLDPQSNDRGYQGTAICVRKGSTTDIYFTSTNPEITYQTQYADQTLVFAGTFGHVTLNSDNSFQSMRLIGGKEFRYGRHQIKFNEQDQRYGLIQAVDIQESNIEVHFDPLLPPASILKDHVLLHIPGNLYPLMYNPMVIKTVDNFEHPQVIDLKHQTNLTNPTLSFASPMNRGDNLLIEPHAELFYKGNDEYSVVSSVPAQVMIDAGEKSNSILYPASILERVRGESIAGAIRFQVDPKEFAEGPAAFRRIP